MSAYKRSGSERQPCSRSAAAIVFASCVAASATLPGSAAAAKGDASGGEVDARWTKEFISAGESLGRVVILPRKDMLELRAVNATLEQLVAKLTELGKFQADFFCADPSSDTEPLNMRIDAGSMQALLLEALGDRYSFTFRDAAGKLIGAVSEAVQIDVRAGECDESVAASRSFRSARSHPLLGGGRRELPYADIESVLRSEGPATRRFALEVLRARADHRGLALAQNALNDPDPKTMIAAARALQGIVARLRRGGHGPQVDAYAKAAATGIVERMRDKPFFELVPMLANLDGEAAWPVIDALTRSASPDASAVALRALVSTKDARGISWLKSMVAASEDAETAEQAAMTIARMGGPAAAMAVQELLVGTDGFRQGAAAGAVVLLGDSEQATGARTTLDALLRKIPVSDDVLSVLVKRRHVEPFESLLSDARVAESAKLEALEAIAANGNDRFVDAVAQALGDGSIAVRLKTVDTLVRLHHGSATPYLAMASRSTDAAVRTAAMTGLGNTFAEPIVINALVAGLSDPERDTRHAAIDSLALLGEPDHELVLVLVEHLEDDDAYVAAGAARILRAWGIR